MSNMISNSINIYQMSQNIYPLEWKPQRNEGGSSIDTKDRWLTLLFKLVPIVTNRINSAAKIPGFLYIISTSHYSSLSYAALFRHQTKIVLVINLLKITFWHVSPYMGHITSSIFVNIWQLRSFSSLLLLSFQ